MHPLWTPPDDGKPYRRGDTFLLIGGVSVGTLLIILSVAAWQFLSGN